MSAQKYSRLLHTVRYLKLQQVAFRLYYQFARVRSNRYINTSVRNWTGNWSVTTWANLTTHDAVEFTFLGMRSEVRSARDWQINPHGKLWLYNLHYLDNLNANGIDKHPALADRLITNWEDANPPATGEGWEPYPLSLRIVNLVKWLCGEKEPKGTRLDNLATQVDALAQQLEYHILGNHIFANAKALVFAGTYLAGPSADRWRAKGMRILDSQIPEQFMCDGGHFELSPMYHAILLWDMCDLVNLCQSSGLDDLVRRLPQWMDVVTRGLTWLHSMLHPDGKISFFNDAAFGVAPEYAQIEAYAKRLGIPIVINKESTAVLNSSSGYAVVTPASEVKALLDLASVGPNYQPGHAHADTLSFELSVFNRRLVVNSGTSQYGEGSERQRQRSTSAHSTVEVDGQNSSEVWAGFRVARRAKVVIERFDVQPSFSFIQASHDGYRRLGGHQHHRRSWQFTSESMEMVDRITGSCCKGVARLYIHPGVKLSQVSSGFVADMGDGNEATIEFVGADDIRLKESTWHPEFGCSLPNHCIEAVFNNGLLTTRICWS